MVKGFCLPRFFGKRFSASHSMRRGECIMCQLCIFHCGHWLDLPLTVPLFPWERRRRTSMHRVQRELFWCSGDPLSTKEKRIDAKGSKTEATAFIRARLGIFTGTSPSKWDIKGILEMPPALLLGARKIDTTELGEGFLERKEKGKKVIKTSIKGLRDDCQIRIKQRIHTRVLFPFPRGGFRGTFIRCPESPFLFQSEMDQSLKQIKHLLGEPSLFRQKLLSLCVQIASHFPISPIN